MPETRSQSAGMEAQIQALLEMKEMKASQEEMKENQKKMENKLEDSQKKIEDKLEENQDQMTECGKMIVTAQADLIQNLEEKLEENRRQIEVELTEVKRISGNKVKPPTFDGKIPWSMYLRQFEAACEANCWSEEEKATALIVALRGDALNILQIIPTSVQANYKTLVAQMDMRFGDRHMQSAYQMQLRTRTQKTGETLQEFEADVAKLLRLSYPTAPSDFLEHIGVETFIRGIRDADTQQALLLARHRTLEDALGHALEFEAAKQATRTNFRVRRMELEEPSEDNKVENWFKKLQSQLDEMKTKIGSLEDKRTRGSPTCWRCGKPGHIRSSCRDRMNSSRRGPETSAGQGSEQ